MSCLRLVLWVKNPKIGSVVQDVKRKCVGVGGFDVEAVHVIGIVKRVRFRTPPEEVVSSYLFAKPLLLCTRPITRATPHATLTTHLGFLACGAEEL